MATIFQDFSSAFDVVLTDFPFDTLANSTVLLHDHLDDPQSIAPFAISCVFSVNDRKLIVTLPYSITDDDFAESLEKYKVLASNWSQPHRIVQSLLTQDGIKPQSVIQLKYTENPSPELIPPNRSEKD